MSKFLERAAIVSAITPVDLATAANNGDWVSMKNYRKCLVVLHKGIGTAGQDPIFRLQQASDVSGTGAKDLQFTRIYSKVGTQTGIGTFTVTTQTAATSYTAAASAAAEAIIAVEIDAAQLDADNGFDCIRLDIADVGAAAQIGGALYILFDPRFASESMPSAIAD